LLQTGAKNNGSGTTKHLMRGIKSHHLSEYKKVKKLMKIFLAFMFIFCYHYKAIRLSRFMAEWFS